MIRVVVTICCCTIMVAVSACLPSAPPYPDREASEIRTQAQVLSDRLASYIEAWFEGKVPARVPDSLIPSGIREVRDFVLVHPDSISPEDVWLERRAEQVEFSAIRTGLPDPHVTYYLLGPALAPFGHRVVLEGEFPHARFFSMQITPPLNGKQYVPARVYGGAEVSIVDLDIEPLEGHVNPYRPGVDRNSTNRRYRQVFDLAIGDPVALNSGEFKPPYRGKHRRVAGLLVYAGPWGRYDFSDTPIAGGGDWDLGAIWIRTYAPDLDKDHRGGVQMPKIWYETPSGKRYMFKADLTVIRQLADRRNPARVNNINLPTQHSHSGVGWGKSFGILRSILNGALIENNWTHPDSVKRVNLIDLGVNGRGENVEPPGNYEAHSTTNNYVHYIGRSTVIPEGSVGVLTGRMPTHPRTRKGGSDLSPADVRYWSMCTYDYEPLSPTVSSCLSGIMDEDVLLDSSGYYVLVYSREADRPLKARAENGVNWVNWGPSSNLGWMMRWLIVPPEWKSEVTPDEFALPWRSADFSGSAYDSTLIGENWNRGFMKDYLPRVHIMKKAEFDSVWPVAIRDFPVWIDSNRAFGPNDAVGKPTFVSAQADSSTGGEKAVDRNFQTVWRTPFASTNQWLTVDLQENHRISGIRIFWGFTHAARYKIYLSDDNREWRLVHEEARGNGGIDVLRFKKWNGRYVRVHVDEANLAISDLVDVEVYTLPKLGDPSSVSDNNGLVPLCSLSPNPAATELVISCPDLDMGGGFLSVSVSNLEGDLVLPKAVLKPGQPVDVSSLSNGQYSIVVRSIGRTWIGTLVVLR